MLDRMVSSPRRRRRALLGGSVVLVAGAVAALVLALGDHTPGNPAPTGNEGPAQLLSNVHYRLSAADRREIDALFERWMPAAVGRENLALAWADAGPEMRSATTHALWLQDNLPVPTYPISHEGLDGWRALDIGRDYVDYALLAHPKKGATAPVEVFHGRVVRRGSGWAVDRIYTAAFMNPVREKTHEVGPADFVAPGSSQTPTNDGASGSLSHTWLLAAFVAPGLAVLGLLVFGLVVLVRSRRWKRDVRANGRNELPPLPAGYRRS